MLTRRSLLFALMLLASFTTSGSAVEPTLVDVGVAKVDITPTEPIRLSGYGFRRQPHEGVLHPIWAKALAVGSDAAGPAVLLAVDGTCIPESVTDEVSKRLAAKTKVVPDKFALSYTHTHTAPMVVGGLDTLFGEPVPPDHQAAIERYTAELINKLEQVSIDALGARRPGTLSWAVGKVDFAANRRTPGGPVDHSLPVMFVRDADGSLRGIVTNYACHNTTLDDNLISGDWAGYAQVHLERAHPEAIAMITIGCGADSNPNPRRTHELAEQHGRSLAAEIERLLTVEAKPISGNIVAQRERIELPFDTLPTRAEWEARAKAQDAVGYHARVQLARLEAGQALPTELGYNVQTWAFGDDLAMVFLPGEVVVDYELRLKRTFDPARVWVNAYANDAPCYIPSRRIWEEGGYEGANAMTYYDRPTRLTPVCEDLIFAALDRLVPPAFRNQPKPSAKPTSAVHGEADGSLVLSAVNSEVFGPTLQYMPEDGALGWWNSPEDYCAWTVDVPAEGEYTLSMEWSCDESCAGNRFVFEGPTTRLAGTVPSTKTWQTHVQQEFGVIRLAAGEQRLIFRADGPIKEALLDLRWVKLAPVTQAK